MAVNKKPVKGADVSAPVRHVKFDGAEYPMVYSNRTARIVEDVYAEEYGHPELGYYDVLSELVVPKHRAVMALAYAAIRAGGAEVTFSDFDERFLITDIEGMRESMQAAVLATLPEADGDDAKNGEAAPES